MESPLLRRRIEVLYRMFEERQGYENYYARSLELQEIQAGELAGIMEDLASAPDAPFRKLKGDLDTELRRKFGVEEVMPWHLSESSWLFWTEVNPDELNQWVYYNRDMVWRLIYGRGMEPPG